MNKKDLEILPPGQPDSRTGLCGWTAWGGDPGTFVQGSVVRSKDMGSGIGTPSSNPAFPGEGLLLPICEMGIKILRNHHN